MSQVRTTHKFTRENLIGIRPRLETRLYSTRQKKEILPHHARQSRKGNHGEITWHLLSGAYYLFELDINSYGNGGWILHLLIIKETDTGLYEDYRPVNVPPDWLKELMPIGALKTLFPEL